MQILNVCEGWVWGKGMCWGTCGRRHPGLEAGQNLFYRQVCHMHWRGTCHRGAGRCRHMHKEYDSYMEELTNLVGPADAAWDWTIDGPEVPQDELTRLLRASTAINPEAVIDGMLQLVHGDAALEAYLQDVRRSVH